MTSDRRPIPPFPALRNVIALLVLMLSSALLTAGVLVWIKRPEQLLPALAGAAVCTLGALVAMELIRRGAKQSAQRLIVMSMAGASARLGVTFLGGCGLVFIAGMPIKAVASWLLGWYLLLLVAEVRVVAKYLASLSDASLVSGLKVAEGR